MAVGVIPVRNAVIASVRSKGRRRKNPKNAMTMFAARTFQTVPRNEPLVTARSSDYRNSIRATSQGIKFEST